MGLTSTTFHIPVPTCTLHAKHMLYMSLTCMHVHYTIMQLSLFLCRYTS